MKIAAQQVSISQEYGAVVLGFLNDEQSPSQYVLLQRKLEPDNQDQALGHDRVHLQVNDESTAGYCDMEKAVLTQCRLSLLLTRESAKHLGVDETIEIQLPVPYQESSAIEAACKMLFGDVCFKLDDETLA